jgi:predicted Rossmann fold flavoprotein
MSGAERFDAVVIGGGAAGLMCAQEAGHRGARVLVIEHANKLGKKILMSGGGRCNFTNLDASPANYLSANPHYCKSALARYTPSHFIALVDRHRVPYHEKERGQLFCDDSSRRILRLLLDECEASSRVQIATECTVERVEHDGALFRLRSSLGPVAAGALVIATGGLSIPKMGATGFGYTLARQLGHRVLPTRAGLVPLTLSGRSLEDWAELAGVATAVRASTGGRAFDGGLLFTHRGLSGPAILQLSSYWSAGEPVQLDWLAGRDAEAGLNAFRRERPAAELRTVLGELLPKRLAQRLCERWLGSVPMRQLRAADLRTVAQRLQAWEILPSGTEGYRTAEVTLGGVSTDELSSSTMMSRRLAGLYFIGEVVDVTGQLGGYNFQWAWASGVAAGIAIAERRATAA